MLLFNIQKVIKPFPLAGEEIKSTGLIQLAKYNKKEK